jgi:hypothetical protein
MPQLQPEHEQPQRQQAQAAIAPQAESQDENWTFLSGFDQESTEELAEEDDHLAEEHRRARHASAFAGCIHGGATAFISQTLAGGAGGDDDLLIQGAGVWVARDARGDPLPMLRSKPVVFCHPVLLDADEGQLVRASDHGRLMNYLGFVTGGEQPPSELVAIGTMAAIEDWSPGATIQGSNPGTLGAYCTTSNGTAGILTAGHVTDGQKAVTIGTGNASVLVEYHAGSSPTPLAIGPDFAVIEIPTGQLPGTPLIPRTTQVPPSDPLTIHGGVASGNVLAHATFLRVQSRSGCWGSVYLLDTSIGGPGNSGAAVTDSAGRLAGHYLGRLAGRWAVVQDVTYLSSELARWRTTIP